MYYPYFRGKQFELIAIRESARLIADSGFVPVIEPVRESLAGLEKAINALVDCESQAIIVVNPRYGDHRENGESIADFLQQKYKNDHLISAGILLGSETTVSQAEDLIKQFNSPGTTLIHAGFTEPQTLSGIIERDGKEFRNIFIEDQANLLYRRHFRGVPRILVSDGFVQMKNSAYPAIETFSDLHITYQERGMDGYGDFLTVGDSYSEGGGPAYAVAIHLTFIDPTREDAMFIYHFKSDTNDTPTDPAGKFAQALRKLIRQLDTGESRLYETAAIVELRDLYKRGHFPGLGYVKKLSIKHHLETLSIYHARATHGG